MKRFCMNSIVKKIESTVLQDKIIKWCEAGSGDFSEYDVDKYFDLHDPDEKQIRFDTLEGLLKLGELQRVGTRRGWYRRIDRTLNIINWKTAETQEYPLKLPFSLHSQVKVFPKSLIAISGEKNTSKTAICLNIVKLNQNKNIPIYYFSSEMMW